MKILFALALTGLAAPALCLDQPTPEPQPAPTKAPEPVQVAPPEPHPVEVMRKEAAGALKLVTSLVAQQFLIATSWLPVVEERTLYVKPGERRFLSKDEYEALKPEEQKGFESRQVSPTEYYYTRYGTPLAYCRPLDLVAQQFDKDYQLKGRRVLDFGYGTIGHLRLMASLGADVTGVDVDPVLRALYASPGDTGHIDGAKFPNPMPDGTLTLASGRWPGDRDVATKVGGEYDIIISKNTLKNGYINPAEKVDDRMLVHLGVSNEEFVTALAAALKPGGVLMIYNLCPRQKEPGKGYIPWADGRCPFPREVLEKAGFQVVEFDKDDTDMARRLGRALMWDEGPQPMDIDADLFATYTLLRKK